MTRYPTRDDLRAAEAAIRAHVRETPVIVTPAGDFGLAGQPIAFKLEFLQHSGTFKARGAFANLLMRDRSGDSVVVAASGGNHGAAVAYAAMRLGRRARIYVPSISSPAKVERIRSYGAEVVVGGSAYVDALAASDQWARENDALTVHAFDRFETVAGQGTAGLELARQAPELDTVLVAVGGGGLIAGLAAAYGGRVRLVGVEPETSPTLAWALDAGEPVDVPVSGIAADSLGARRIGAIAFALRHHLHGSILVTDAEIANAQWLLWDQLRIVAEPGGAAAFAALISGRYQPAEGERVGVLLCGANAAGLPAAI